VDSATGTGVRVPAGGKQRARGKPARAPYIILTPFRTFTPGARALAPTTTAHVRPRFPSDCCHRPLIVCRVVAGDFLADQQRRTRAGAARGRGQQFAGDPATGTRLREVLLRFHGKPRDYPIVLFFLLLSDIDRPTCDNNENK